MYFPDEYWADDGERAPSAAEEHCVGSTNWTTYYNPPPWAVECPFGAEITFTLPLDSDALYLISRGALQSGLVNIEQSTKVADTVDVRVRVAYYDRKVLDLATVCNVKRADREYGVGVFTPRKVSHRPRRRRPQDQLLFDITFTLPTENEGPLSVKQLETRLSNYGQNVADLQDSVLFDRISLASANGRLSVQSVTSEVGRFSSSNGSIDGHFNARSSLDLYTANGGIASTVSLLHREGAGASSLTMNSLRGYGIFPSTAANDLQLNLGFSEINAELSLASAALTGGEFKVDAMSTSGKIELKYTRTPVDSVLRSYAQAATGAIKVELDSAFEGAYSLQSVVGERLVSEREVEDPTGRGRRRVVSQVSVAGRVEGEVKWVESDGSSSENEGLVVLKGVVSSVSLFV